MKVLHVISGLPPRAGGPTTVVRSLADVQARLGYEVTICTTNVDLPTGVLDRPTNVAVGEGRVTIWYHSLDVRPMVFSVSLCRWLLGHVGDFDIVHVHGLYRFPATFAATLARRRRVPYLICPHGALDPFLFRRSSRSVALKRAYERLFELPNLNQAGAIQFTSQDEEDRVAFLRLRAPFVVVPNGLDFELFARLPMRGAFRERIGVAESAPLILFLGRLTFKKGLDLLIPAVARVRQSVPGVVLAIVGPDNEGFGEHARRWCAEHGIGGAVRFLDQISPEETRQAYVDADVFALSSYTENFGMTVVEAMACGCPVVISDQVNIWPFVSAAGAGTVVSLQVDRIGDALVGMLRDPGARTRMGAAGRVLVQERFSWSQISNQLERVYGSIIRGESPEFCATRSGI